MVHEVRVRGDIVVQSGAEGEVELGAQPRLGSHGPDPRALSREAGGAGAGGQRRGGGEPRGTLLGVRGAGQLGGVGRGILERSFSL